jgi:hypothetical protein
MKKCQLLLLLVVMLIGFSIITNGCSSSSSSSSSGGAVMPIGNAMVLKVTQHDMNTSLTNNVVQLGLLNASIGVPTGTHTVTYPNNSGSITLQVNTNPVTLISNYYFGSLPTFVGNINDPLETPASIAPYEVYGVVPGGSEAGNYIFNISDGSQVTVTDNAVFESPINITSPIANPTVGSPININWTPLNANYGYLVVAYTEDSNGNKPKEWANVDIQNATFANPQTLIDMSGILPTTTSTTIPAGIFTAGDEVIIEVMGVNRATSNFVSATPYGAFNFDVVMTSKTVVVQ